LDISYQLLFYFSIIVFFGGFIKGITGFGIALVAIPFLSQILDVKTAIPIIAIFSGPFSLPIAIQLRKYIDKKVTLIFFIFNIPGCYFGGQLIRILSGQILEIILGILLFIISSYSLIANKALLKKEHTGLSAIVGFLSGVFGTSVGASGPPLVVYSSQLPWSAHKIKATLSCIFLIQCPLITYNFWQQNLITKEVIHLGVISLPLLLCSTILGMWVYNQMIRHNFNLKKWVNVMLLFIGIKSVLAPFLG